MKKLKLMFVFGTRPEAIKLAPLILKAGESRYNLEPITVVTAQHREMLDEILSTFGIIPDIDLNVRTPGQSLFYTTSKIIAAMESVIEASQPDLLIYQGDTTTTLAAALCGYYAGKKTAHVEAGLRTGNKRMPFPEEVNRKMASVVTDYHFAPTESAKKNLILEGYDPTTIHVTGNTVIDALLWTVDLVKKRDCLCPNIKNVLDRYSRTVLITGHRRESLGLPLKNICQAFRSLAMNNPKTAFVYPVHLNPGVQKTVTETLAGLKNFFLLPPLPYPAFCWLMQHCYLIITDSGGVQEEAPALGKPVLVTRSVTERPEAVQEGLVKLVGNSKKKIIENTQRLLEDKIFYAAMAKGSSPYGDGKSSQRILDILVSKEA